ncbi:hypothetical protein GUITHDRAFT_122130 [Guillardia theta CCMP2712]|uniref:Fungal lipase-type domain-containing protein n=1 Tax=Guillardia theta (strain CCMP2712) TaxID=905079 RepID=L1I714_GUITC|nr:hypothetical protein GUITHDRAFT_122130 [Guillardia theta CCMP2712]EKX31669.1 hypothetical protein GUITHDRAFT_122130 [Guillardia theta CCMP2712]|eukprot:XP_005818649.1 hypothetical protein GUITHDRAFT_122130 [Guillardia theta CCMP2712]
MCVGHGLSYHFIGLGCLAALERDGELIGPILYGPRVMEWGTGAVHVVAHRLQDGEGSIVSFEHRVGVEECDFTLVPHEPCCLFDGVPPDAMITKTASDGIDELMESGVGARVLDYISGLDPDERICLTGYDMGGVMAQLFALTCRRAFVMTMGRPMFANRAFTKWYNNTVHSVSCFIAKGDSIADYCRARASGGLHEDAGVIILDNNEDLPQETPDGTLRNHGRDYYRRCFSNLRRRRQRIGPMMDPAIAGRYISRLARPPPGRMGMIARARRMIEDGLLGDNSAAKTAYRSLAERINQKAVISNTARFVSGLLYLIKRAQIRSGRATLEGSDPPRSFNARPVVASVLIKWHPRACFESMGAMEEDLRARAVALIKRLSDIAASMASPGFSFSIDACLGWEGLDEELTGYLAAFERWRVPDKKRVASRISHSLRALYVAHSRLKDRGDAEFMNMHRDFIAQKEKLRKQYAACIGKEELARLDAEFGMIDVKEAAGSQDAAGTTRPPQKQDRMNNEQLAYELFLDPNFRIKDGYQELNRGVLDGVRNAFREAFWESLVDDMRLQPPVYCRVIKVLGDILNGYTEIVPSERALMMDIVNLQLIQERVASDSLGWADTVALIRLLAGKVHDLDGFKEREVEHMKRWGEIDASMDTAPAVQHPGIIGGSLCLILDGLNLARVHSANENLRKISWVIAAHGVDYLRSAYKARGARGDRAHPDAGARGGKRGGLSDRHKARHPQDGNRQRVPRRDGYPPAARDGCQAPKGPPDGFSMDRITVAMIGMARQRLLAHADREEASALAEAFATAINGFSITGTLNSDLPGDFSRERQVAAVIAALEDSLSIEQKRVAASIMGQPQCDLAAFLRFDDNVWRITHRVVYNSPHGFRHQDHLYKDLPQRTQDPRAGKTDIDIYAPFYNQAITSAFSQTDISNGNGN